VMLSMWEFESLLTDFALSPAQKIGRGAVNIWVWLAGCHSVSKTGVAGVRFSPPMPKKKIKDLTSVSDAAIVEVLRIPDIARQDKGWRLGKTSTWCW
jgi:hypothetical protein